MGSPLPRFVPRAPRFLFRPSDKAMLRFVQNGDTDHPHSTQLINLSTSGAAFLAPRHECPMVGEVLKVEFPIANGESIAWWGRVVRVEEHARKLWWKAKNKVAVPDTLMVAITFQDLPAGHIKTIEKGLKQKWRESFIEHKHMRNQMIWAWLTDKGFRYLVYAALTAMTFYILYLLALPTYNYDPNRGTAWGKRFQFFKWENE